MVYQQIMKSQNNESSDMHENHITSVRHYVSFIVG